MSDFVECATSIMVAAERRLESVARNVSNISTPGYKREIPFSDLISKSSADTAAMRSVRYDHSQGGLTETGNALDVAVSGNGYFRLRNGNQYVYSRAGQFALASTGEVVNPQGMVLQQAGGGDLVLDHGAVTIEADGVVLDAGVPVSKIGVFAVVDEAMPAAATNGFALLDDCEIELVDTPVLRQGMLESSNVDLGDEMVSSMQASRGFETGARLVQTYDELLGRVFSTLGRVGQ
ncbi:flagellar hook-basal body protein [Sphingosinithalassobacter portus]|uniref:flagellar hook-basal body protein n=1 Tax=Stakelama portus TaxID=2676234 RepID=UPI000D6E688B|nr:flagellar hook basal-body protein [Sphingosinithalassobacter portus]